jgi:hypothetical protein
LCHHSTGFINQNLTPKMAGSLQKGTIFFTLKEKEGANATPLGRNTNH